MADQQFVIDIEGERAAIDADAWLEQVLRDGRESARLRLRYDESDTEGHAFAGTRIRVIVEDADDAEGHAMSLRFPSIEEAATFRKRLLASGVLVGTVALGAIAGTGLANLAGGSPADGTETGLAAAVSAPTSAPVDGSAWTQDERQALADDEWVLEGGGGPPKLE
jgi:hypothetical protein